MVAVGRRGTPSLFMVFFPLTVLVAMTVLAGGDAVAADGGDPTPPDEGDWNITETTTLEGVEVNVTGDINVTRDTFLAIRNSTVRVLHSSHRRCTMRLEARASLVVVNSTLILDAFVSDPQSSIDLSEDTIIRTNGVCLLRSRTLYADRVTFLNQAPSVGADEDGMNATVVLDGSVNSGFRGVTVRNVASSAGMTSPGANGSAGGNAVIISNVTSWEDCTIECRAGAARGGGLGLTGASGGSGGRGGDARVVLRARYLKEVDVQVFASDGGQGARGSRNTAGNGGDGGDAGEGGDALVRVDCPSTLEVLGCTIDARSGNGGSGGNGGEAIDGTGGTGGHGGNAGTCTVEVSCPGDIIIEDTEVQAIGGEGGYGGDYGRHEGGTGSFGMPRAGGDGGNATVEVLGEASIHIDDTELEARGGAGLDGGGGYEQGDTGGKGAEGRVIVHAEAAIESSGVDLNAVGGNGGPGGPAYSDIRGEGGDGGDALAEFSGLLEMEMDHFSIYVTAGEGGLGNKPIYDGGPGIATLDLETQLLYAREGTFNQPLDDLSGNARGFLYNVFFDMEFGIHVLPIGDAIVWEVFSVVVLLVDHPDPGVAEPLVGWEISVFRTTTGELVAQGVTDGEGKCYFDLMAFEYTSLQVNYLGSYHFIATSPDGKTVKKVRGEIQAKTRIWMGVNRPSPDLFITIEAPEDGMEYQMYPSRGDHLDTQGYVMCSYQVVSVSVRLYPKDEDPASWPLYKLGLSPVPLDNLTDPEDRWGMYFPPNATSNRWWFFFGFQMNDEAREYFDWDWILKVYALSPTESENASVEFVMLVDENLERPWVRVDTPIDGETFDGSLVVIHGTAGDDLHLVNVQVRIDSAQWETVSTAGDWTYNLDTSTLEDGYHTIDFMAYDGKFFSDINASSFEVRSEQDPSGNGGGGDDGIDWDTRTTFIAAGILLFVVALALLVAVAIVRRRSPPDS